jgi:serine/threonine protein kinase
MTDNSLYGRLSDPERRLVEARVAAFEETWNEKSLSAAMGDLPPREDPLRAVLLAAFARADLGQHWRRGNHVAVETYLQICPELGDRDTVPLALLVAEYEARRDVAPADVEEFVRRFPSRAEEIRQHFPRPAGAADTSSGDSSATAPRLPGTGPGGGERGVVLPELFGRYRILRPLGQGSMGTVYLALDTSLGRHVALKVPRFIADEGPEVRARFFREARCAATIDHPNICPVYESGEIGGVHYLAMAYIEGKPLAEVAEGAMPPRQAAALVLKLAAALAEAHARNVVHRDLKPGNVMINQRGEPILMDFGLALHINQADERLTQTGAVLGTPAFMAPEQVSGDVAAHGPKMDVYSLGALLYRLLSGRAPFVGQVTHVFVQVLHDQPPPLSSVQPGVSPDLEAVCRRAMAKNPADRFASMQELAAALTAYLDRPPAPEEAATLSRTAPSPLPLERDAPTHPIEGDNGRRRASAGEDHDTERIGTEPGPDETRRKRGVMSLRAWLVLGGLTLLALGGFGAWALLRTDRTPPPDDRHTGGPEPVNPAPPPQTKPPLPQGWVKFSPPGDFLSVALPGKPVSKTATMRVGGMMLTQFHYTVKDGRSGYMVGYVDLPRQDFTEKDLDVFAGRITERLKPLQNSKLIAQKRITLDGFPGVESEFEGEQNQELMHYLARFYMVQRRVIALGVMVPPEHAGSEKVKTFFDSLRLNP